MGRAKKRRKSAALRKVQRRARTMSREINRRKKQQKFDLAIARLTHYLMSVYLNEKE